VEACPEVRRLGGLAATTVALTAVLIMIFGALILPRSVGWLVERIGTANPSEAASNGAATSEEERQRQLDILWDFHREAQTLLQLSNQERDTTNDAFQAIISGDPNSPGLYILLKEAERSQNRAAARIREFPTIPQARQARSDYYAGFRARADAASRYAEFLRSRKLDELWAGKLDQERGDRLIEGANSATLAIGRTLGIDLSTGLDQR
jgi:hypothetical protein